jgi:hypothetical protein
MQAVGEISFARGMDDRSRGAPVFGTTFGERTGVHLLSAAFAEVELDLGQLADAMFEVTK